MRALKIHSVLFILTLSLWSCSKTTSNGFEDGIDPNATLEGFWKSMAYDFSLTNGVTNLVDSAFSFTGPILEETYTSDGERIRTFLGFSENYTYSRADNQLYFAKNNDTVTATITTLTSSHFAYTIERSFVLDDTLRYAYTSAQLVR